MYRDMRAGSIDILHDEHVSAQLVFLTLFLLFPLLPHCTPFWLFFKIHHVCNVYLSFFSGNLFFLSDHKPIHFCSQTWPETAMGDPAYVRVVKLCGTHHETPFEAVSIPKRHPLRHPFWTSKMQMQIWRCQRHDAFPPPEIGVAW